jgi:tRNA(fMet)-specific endonuclease VapC
MFDTDTASYAMRGQGRVAHRILQHRRSDLCISVLTLAQLRHGATLRNSAKLHLLIDTLVSDIAVVPFDEACASRYADLGVDLTRRGSVIGEFDTLIAAHALALDLTLVTNNVKHFDRVRGLKIENWL